jgi:branched-chain amino acid transport system ATP-binding protein
VAPIGSSEVILKVVELVAGYGVTRVLHGVSFSIQARQIVTLIGANGAGKTTTLRTLLGLTRIHKGSILFFGEELIGRRSYTIAQQGLGFVPQERNIFPTLSVRENLEMGGYLLKSAELGTRIEYVTNFLPVLKDRMQQQAGTLSGGERRMLAIGRALIARPRLLMLDEPSLGLAPKVVDAVFERVHAIHEDGVGILIVEQNARRALGIADHGYVLELGHVRLEGSGQELLNDPNVQKSYLGR